jgi:hypothetical protein
MTGKYEGGFTNLDKKNGCVFALLVKRHGDFV